MGISRKFQSLDLSFGKCSIEGAQDKDTNSIIKMAKRHMKSIKILGKRKEL